MTGPAARSTRDPGEEHGPGAAQAAVAQARARLMGGRGAGASQAEVARRTNDRPWLGGRPTPQHLAAVAHQTALAHGDASALAADAAEANDRLATTVAAIRQQVSPARLPGALARGVDAHPWATGAALGVGACLVVGRRGR